jgi:hypothetical protein
MSTAPPRLMIGLAERLIPPDAREAVLGDLWERYRSPLHFAGQLLAVLPFLVFAQVIRRSSWPILGLQTFILFACLRGFAPADALESDMWLPSPWARAALPTICAFLALAWHDAYRGTAPDLPPRAPWGAAAAVLVGIGIAQAVTVAIVSVTHLPPAWLLTGPQLLFAAIALPILCVFRSGSWLRVSRSPVQHADVVQEYALFRARVRRRNRIEVGAMAATLLVTGLILARAQMPVTPIIWATLAGFAILAGYLAAQGGAAAPAPRASPAQVNSLFLMEVNRQHRLRSLLMWWWLMPLFIGLAAHFLLAPAPSPVRPIIGSLLLMLLAACIHMSNVERGGVVRRQMEALSREFS